MATVWIGSPVQAIFLRLLVAAVGLAASVTAQLKVVTTIPDFADIAARIGGDAVSSVSLTHGHEDLHLVRIRPSLLVKLREADAFVQLGLDGEHAWVPAMMRSARNRDIQPGRPGFCDASVGVEPLDVPAAVTRGAGPDLHPHGNPHYNLDPTRMRIAARNIRDCLIRLAPDRESEFVARCKDWEAELDRRLATWREKLEPLRGARFIEAHSSWTYFADTFGFVVVGKLEPSPGASPTASYLAELVRIGAEENVGLVVARPRYEDVARRVAKELGAEVAVLDITSADEGERRGWFEFMDQVVDTFAEHLRKPASGAKKGRKE